MTKISDTAVIIPAYNEGEVIKENLRKVCQKFDYVVCVNDGSPDDTTAEACKTTAKVIDHPVNLGAGAATQTGIEYALRNPKIKYFVTIDADGQHRVEDAVAMREYIEKSGNDIVLGSRFMGKVEDMKAAKKMLIKAATKFSNQTSGLKLTDTHNGLRIFNRHVAETLNLTEPGYQHCSELLDRIRENHYKYSEFPVTVLYTDYSRSKGQSMINAVNIGLDVVVNKVTKR